MGVCLFESIWSFESTAGVWISTVRIVPTKLFKVVTPLSPHRSSLRNEIVNQIGICILLSKKQRMYMHIKMAIDHLNLSKQMAGKNILLLQCSVHLRIIITRSTITSASPTGSSISITKFNTAKIFWLENKFILLRNVIIFNIAMISFLLHPLENSFLHLQDMKFCTMILTIMKKIHSTDQNILEKLILGFSL